MATIKNKTKTENVVAHLKRYKRINRATALTVYGVGNLPDQIRKIRASRGLNIVLVEGTAPNTKYELITEEKDD